ncbi:MAG: RluA family pseudouridine synthase [Phycisphaerales bacterium]
MSRPADRDNEQDDRPVILPGGKVDAEAVRDAIERGDGDDDGFQRVSFTLSRDLNKRLDKYLTDRIPFLSRTALQRVISEEGVTVNGRMPKASTRLRLGDVVEVLIPPPPSKEIVGEDIPIEVLYEDERILVLNKQPDIIVHPARSHNKGTLLNALVWYFEHSSTMGGSLSNVGKDFARPGVVHRLDRHTTGVMVIAKDEEAHWRLGRQFERRTVNKRYLAVVHGEVDRDADVIDFPIGPSPSKAKGMREKMVIRHDELGKNAVTICRVRERYEGYTLVELELKTGRTHQIRVHMSHLGFPIVGDDMYGGRIVKASHLDPGGSDDDTVIGRQALHACVLGFRDPVSHEPLEFTAPVAMDMLRLIRTLRAHKGTGWGVEVAGATIDLPTAVPERP